MAQSALVSLRNTMKLILHSDHFEFFHVKPHVISLHTKVLILQSLLQHSPQKCSDEETNSMEERISEVAYLAELEIESVSPAQVSNDHKKIMGRLDPDTKVIKNFDDDEYQKLEKIIVEFDSIVEELMNDDCGAALKDLQPRKYMTPKIGSCKLARTGESVMAVFNPEDMMILKDRLVGEQSKLEIIPIVGMGGIGKTTLARNLYKDSTVEYFFDVRVWVTISQTYHVREVLVGLLENIGGCSQDEMSVQNLILSLYMNLMGKKYLVVLDDMWDIEVWNDLEEAFPNDKNGSRIMLTTRLMNMASTASFSPPHEVHLLNGDKSWDLLCQQIFGNEDCPQELKKIGRVIAMNCGGLPLTISITGRLLASSSKTQEFWKHVSENLNSIAIETDEHCSEILSLSYNHLPHNLKPCFLYFRVFREDEKIKVQKLIRLWVAEGILKPIGSKSLEEAAEEYLKDLIDINLVFVRERGSNGRIKSCGVHGLVRDLCIKEAHKGNVRRLSVHFDTLKGDDITDEVCNALKSMVFARSLLSTGRIYDRLLWRRTLDVFISESNCEIPSEILQMTQLRHIQMDECYLTNPIDAKNSIIVWKELQTLSTVSNFRCTDEVLKKFPNLRKLGVFYNASQISNWSDYHFQNLARFSKLESLKCDFSWPPDRTLSRNLMFPQSLKKLTLRLSKFRWKDMMSVIGSLPNLEVLKLKEHAFVGEVWEPVEGGFCRLKYLLIENTNLVKWVADETHFPCLEQLFLKECYALDEIPSGIGDTVTLRLIEVDDFNSSIVTSVKQILEEQRSMGNDLIVCIKHGDRKVLL